MLGPEVPSISFLLGLGLSEPWAARGPFNSRLWELKLMFLASTMSLGVAYGTGSFVTRILWTLADEFHLRLMLLLILSRLKQVKPTKKAVP